MIRLSKAGNRHTMYNFKDDDLRNLYLELPVDSEFRVLIFNHLVKTVTEAELIDGNIETPEEYIENYLGIS